MEEPALTLRHSQGLNFWRAIDELCDTAALQYNPSMHGIVGQQDQGLALTEGVTRTITPISDHGPFRVRLMGVDYHRSVNYLRGGPRGLRCRRSLVRLSPASSAALARVRPGSIRSRPSNSMLSFWSRPSPGSRSRPAVSSG